MSMLNKLKYAGISESDLLTIYKLFIRSICEYCSALFHSSLTQELSKKIEAIQSTALKIILADKYTDYKSALKYFQIESLFQRRENHMVKFAIKCTRDAFNSTLFPKNTNRSCKEEYQVNYARTTQYLQSTIPQCQRLLNKLPTHK